MVRSMQINLLFIKRAILLYAIFSLCWLATSQFA